MQIIFDTIKKWKNIIIDILFPVECVSCGQSGEWLCRNCFRDIKINIFQSCPGCQGNSESGSFCQTCVDSYALNGILVACSYNDREIKQLIKNLKYHFVSPIALILGNVLVRFLRNYISSRRLTSLGINNSDLGIKLEKIIKSPDIFFDFQKLLIIPVPLHKKRLKWRGFNQSEEIAKVVADHFGIEIDSLSLKRIKYTKAQAKLKRSDRLNNLAGIFDWSSNELGGRNVLLVDDVITTGATLNECAKILKSVGAGSVWGLVVARG